MADLLLTYRNRRVRVASLAEASSIYSQARDKSGLGASRWPEGAILRDGKMVARISYNGRVWKPGEWKPGDVPIYDNRTKGC